MHGCTELEMELFLVSREQGKARIRIASPLFRGLHNVVILQCTNLLLIK